MTINDDGASFYGKIPPRSPPGELRYPFLDTPLNRLVEAEKRGEAEAFAETDDRIILVDGSVTVMVTPQPGQLEDALSAIEKFGGKVDFVSRTSSQIISATVPITSLVDLAYEESIRTIRVPELMDQCD